MKKCIHTINGVQVKNTQRNFLRKGNFDFSMEGQFCSMINKNKLVYKICGGLLTLIEKKIRKKITKTNFNKKKILTIGKG